MRGGMAQALDVGHRRTPLGSFAIFGHRLVRNLFTLWFIDGCSLPQYFQLISAERVIP
jgi:hypothetical protein